MCGAGLLVRVRLAAMRGPGAVRGPVGVPVVEVDASAGVPGVQAGKFRQMTEYAGGSFVLSLAGHLGDGIQRGN